MDYINNDDYNSMDYSRLIQSYCYDLTYLTDIVAKLSGTYNLLISSADSFNKIALAKKDDVKDALDRAEDLGDIIDKIINTLKIQTELYVDYSKIKNQYIIKNFSFNDIIKSEVDHNIKHEKHEEHEEHEEHDEHN